MELEAPAHGEPTQLGADDPFAGFRLDAGPPFGPPGAEPSMIGHSFGAARDDLDPLGDGADPFAAGAPPRWRRSRSPHTRTRNGATRRPSTGPHTRTRTGATRRPSTGRPRRARGDPGAISPGAELAWADDPFSAAISPAPPGSAWRSAGSRSPTSRTSSATTRGRPPCPRRSRPRATRGDSRPGRREAGGSDRISPSRSGPPRHRRRSGRAADLLADLPLPPREDDLDAGPTELGAPAAAEEEPLALATEPVRGLPEMWRTSPAFPPAPEEVVPPEPARSADVGSSPEAKTEAAARARAARRGALRSIAINAVSLAALLGVALAFRVLWSGEGTAAAAWSPSALLRAVRPGERTAASLETAGVTSGRYPRAAGAPLLFVRGEVISRAPAPLARVRVDVEVVRAGRVLAHRSGLAGAVPTAEELHAVKDAAALDALARAISGRARDVRPGAPVPFLVPFAEVPEDLTGASVRVVASPAR